MSQDDTDQTETHENPSFGEPTLRDNLSHGAEASRQGSPSRREGPDWAKHPSNESLRGVLEAQLKNQTLLIELIKKTDGLDNLERESIETREAIRRVEEDGTYVQGLISEMTHSTEDLNQVVERLQGTQRDLEDRLEPTVEALSGQVGALSQTHKGLKGVEGRLSKTASQLERTIPSIEKLGPKMNLDWMKRAGAAALGLFLVALAGLVFLSPPVFNWVMDTETKIEMLPANIESKIHNYDTHLNRYNSLDAETQKMVGEAMGWTVPERNDESSSVDGDSGKDAPGK